jgi:alkylated DNA repair dioxygenase AlkB
MDEPFEINENGDSIYLVPQWLPKKEATALFNSLLDEAPWPKEPRWNPIFKCYEPRLSLAIGEEQDGLGQPIVHRYSGTASPLVPWNELPCLQVVRKLRDQIEKETGLYHDAASLQLYRTGKDYIDEHADRELKQAISRDPHFQPNPTKTVYALSLGETRRFAFRRNADRQRYTLMVSNGDMLVMEGLKLQSRWTHELPKMMSKAEGSDEPGSAIGPRISITWRLLGDYGKKS